MPKTTKGALWVLALGLGGGFASADDPIEGYGKDATGGAGQPVCTVTSSAATGTGTFDWCVAQGGNRVIQFAVGTATVARVSRLESNTTVDGCANGRNGVTLNLPANQSRSVVLEGPVSNVIVRCLRFQGSGPKKPGYRSENDLLALDGEEGLVTRVVVDRCTFVGASDGALDITGDVSDVTVSFNLFYNNPLTQLIKYGARRRISLHHNVYTANGERNPQVKGDARDVDFVSNVVYGMTIEKDGVGNSFSPYGTSLRNAGAGSDSPGNVLANVRSNFFGGVNSGLDVDTEPGASAAGIWIAPDNLCADGCPASPASGANPVPPAYAVTATPPSAMAHELFPRVGSPNRTAGDQGVLLAAASPLYPTLSIEDVSVVEGDVGQQVVVLEVSLSEPAGLPVKVSYASRNGAAVVGRDYQRAAGTLVFPEGSSKAELAILVTGDLVKEAAETFTVSLSAPTNATIADGTSTVTIVDNDPVPALTVADVQVVEGHVGSRNLNFRVMLSAPAPADVSVNWTTANLTATAGGDYLPGAGTLVIRKGLRSGTIVVSVVGDLLDERNEAFLLSLSGAAGVRIVDGRAQGVIMDDEGPKESDVPIASLPYVVTRPGRYRLAGDLSFAPAQGAAVTVAASGVVVDLDGRTLSGTAGAATGAVGVLGRNRSNVTVQNGRIRGFLAGVYLAGPPPYTVASKFAVRDLRAESNTYVGVWLEGRGNVVEGCEVTNTGGTTALDPEVGAVGISSVGAAPKLSLNQVRDTVASPGGDAIGIAADGATGGVVSGNLVKNTLPAARASGVLVTRTKQASVTLNTLDTLTYGIVFTVEASGTCQGNDLIAVTTPVLGVTCEP